MDGNLTNDGRWVYTWDAEHRLIQMETTTQATTAGHPYTKLKYVYDWQGRRIARTVWQGGTAGTPTFKSNRRWIYDGWNVIAEFSATTETTTTVTRLNTFTWGLDLSGTLQGAGGVGGLLVQTAVTGGVMERASYDGNGNIVAWTKSTASAPTSRREYDAFGNTLVSEGAAPNSFGFSTKMQDAETGLYYYGYRYYDALIGRWISRDPIGEDGGENLIGFIGNNSLNEVDMLGLQGADAAVKKKCWVIMFWGHSKDTKSQLKEVAEQMEPGCGGVGGIACNTNAGYETVEKTYPGLGIPGFPSTGGGFSGLSRRATNGGLNPSPVLQPNDPNYNNREYWLPNSSEGWLQSIEKGWAAAKRQAESICATGCCKGREVKVKFTCATFGRSPEARYSRAHKAAKRPGEADIGGSLPKCGQIETIKCGQ
ncbi:MAG: RHS repeat-associated core domain-containing protein [Verrucomicrobiaceae bacterium]|nr:MAG: RHS repeat-associated core domain-containing protein [Verrucomicrobiaceae bacterium]